MNESAVRWQVIDAVIAAEAREAIEYGLMESGAVGSESSPDSSDLIWVRGYFQTANNVESVRAGLLNALRIYSLPASSLINLKTSELVERDWLEEWKKGWQPIKVGRFVIAPAWLTEPRGESNGLTVTTDQIIITVDPGMAFGTGTHETTRLCLKAIEKYFRGGSFLDVGTGTGILAIAAAKMSRDARVEAYDTDSTAVAIAKQNAEANGVQHQIDFRPGSISDETSSADLVCANLTAPTIIELLPLLLAVTCGRLVLSGILDSQIEMTRTGLLQLGAPILETNTDGEWVALVI